MSLISWTNITANPIHLIREDGSHGGHWCQKVSPGCARCYAEAQNQSNYFKFASHLPYSGSAPENLIFDDKVMEKLIRMRSPERVFIGSMTDIVGEWVPDAWLDRAFAYMAIASQHIFQVLTKRPERIPQYFSDRNRARWICDRALDILRDEENPTQWRFKIHGDQLNVKIPLPNVWIGTSVENQKAADDRIPQLLQTPAAVRFLSCEPLLESIDLRKYLHGISWVIIGGESGTDARSCHIDWIKSIVQQCQSANVAVFVKQLGSNPVNAAHLKFKTSDRKGGNIDDFPPELQVREFPQ